MPEQEDYPFPIGDDPEDPAVLLYWSTVAKRLALSPLPPLLRDWSTAIEDRITEFHVATQALAKALDQGDDDEVTKQSRRLSSAVFEFKRIKWKLSLHFGWHFKLSDPALALLFAKVDKAQN